jgi:hypothetical protein
LLLRSRSEAEPVAGGVPAAVEAGGGDAGRDPDSGRAVARRELGARTSRGLASPAATPMNLFIGTLVGPADNRTILATAKELVHQAECVVAHQAGRVGALRLMLTPCWTRRRLRRLPTRQVLAEPARRLQLSWRHRRGLEPRSSLPPVPPPCPKQRSAAVTSGQQRSPSEAPDLCHCRTASSPTVLPKLAVRVRFPSPAPPGSAGHQPAASLPRHRRRGRASRRGRSAGRLPVPVEDTQSP